MTNTTTTTTVTTVTEGTTVALHYVGTLEDGSTFDDSRSKGEPMTVTAGTGQLIAGFDSNIVGMEVGETKTFSVTPEDAYGLRSDEAFVDLEKEIFPEDFEFRVGEVVPLSGPGGRPFLGTITEVSDTTVTTDLNHPLAGKPLTFEVEIMSVTPAATSTVDPGMVNLTEDGDTTTATDD